MFIHFECIFKKINAYFEGFFVYLHINQFQNFSKNRRYFKNVAGLEKCYRREKPDSKFLAVRLLCMYVYTECRVVAYYYYGIAAAARDVIVGALVQCEGEFRKSFDDITHICTRFSRGSLQW